MTIISENIFSLQMISPEIANQARPGQFLQIQIPDVDTALWPRPFSIHKVEDDAITISIKKCGRTTEILSRLGRGDVLFVTGPLGNSFKYPPPERPVYLVAGGVGLPPVHYLCLKILDQGYPAGSIHFYSGAKGADELFAHDELNGLGIDYTVATDNGSFGIRGYVTEPFAVDLAKARTGGRNGEPVVYACGPMPMLKKVAEICHCLECYLSLDQLMPCGWGVCNGCAVKVRAGDNYQIEDERGFRLARVCHEGPVFEASELIWD